MQLFRDYRQAAYDFGRVVAEVDAPGVRRDEASIRESFETEVWVYFIAPHLELESARVADDPGYEAFKEACFARYLDGYNAYFAGDLPDGDRHSRRPERDCTEAVRLWLQPPDGDLAAFHARRLARYEAIRSALDNSDSGDEASALRSWFYFRLRRDPGVPGPFHLLAYNLIGVALDLVDWGAIARDVNRMAQDGRSAGDV